MAAQLAAHSTVAGFDGQRVELSVDANVSSLVGSLAEEKLHAALADYLGRPIRLQLAVGESASETPAQRAQSEAQRRQAATEADISRDPLVLAAQEAFDAEIVPDSVRRLD